MFTLPSLHPQTTRLPKFTHAARSLLLSECYKTYQKPMLVICDSAQQCAWLQAELQFFAKDVESIIFPGWEILPYDSFSPHEDLVSTRLQYLSQLATHQGIVLIDVATILHLLCPTDFIRGQSFVFNVGDTLEPTAFRQQLASQGYRHVEQVFHHGEFSVRGSIVDIFPMGHDTPIRIDLFDTEIDSIRGFDPDSQLSQAPLDKISLLPAHEFPLTDESITAFRQRWRESFSGNPQECPLYQNISKGQAGHGIEYYLALFFERLDNFFAYLSDDTLVVIDDELGQHVDQYWAELLERFDQLQHDRQRPILAPKQIFLAKNDLFSALKAYPVLELGSASNSEEVSALPDLALDHKKKDPFAKLVDFVAHFNGSITLTAESNGRREVIKQLLREAGVLQFDHIDLVIGQLRQGFIIGEQCYISEADLYGETPLQQSNQQKTSSIDPDLMIRHLTELHIGDPVVHLDYGIGLYQGLTTITTQDITTEFLELQYADSDKIYVPVNSLHLIHRYAGQDADHAPLTKLGGKHWQQAKEKAQKRAYDVAAELLAVYSEREASHGFKFNAPGHEFQQFRREFPFVETDDQSSAINAVMADMQNDRPMDRLICGDVGFGKTEVAMQAAFLATQSCKQVVVLVPTTLLVGQHTENFRDRFANWPIRIEGLSRFQSAAEQKKIMDDLLLGKIDIIIGTHKLLNPDIKFKDLGLLIIDEEQRFGVRQKERIKALRANIDILTLTATPIPRTLNLSLSGIRDLSLITTAPAKRLAVKTFVHEYQDRLIREAILREVLRGGQVYFLYNDVAAMPNQLEKLKRLVPEASMQLGHGQMPEKQLEKVMADFYHQRFQVLLASTIIESGIDIPSANTIIIHRADKFGLAQLHQLRGRVGRSHHQAYAYLLTPPWQALSSDAKKRLEAISQLEDLGAGFQLATHDLEIRGAGELIGDAQSGQITQVGFTLFMDMLNETVQQLKQQKGLVSPGQAMPTKPGDFSIDLNCSALLPEDYVGDVAMRLTLYKRLSDIQDKTTLNNFRAELIDRFGLLPIATEQLLLQTEIKLLALPLGVIKIEASKSYVYFYFNKTPKINISTLLGWIQKDSQHYQLTGQEKLRIKLAHDAVVADVVMQHLLGLAG